MDSRAKGLSEEGKLRQITPDVPTASENRKLAGRIARPMQVSTAVIIGQRFNWGTVYASV